MTTKRRWTADRIDALRRLHPTHSAQEIAAALGTTVSSVHYKSAQLGLKKSTEWIAERTRQAMANPDHPGRRSQFSPGLIPHNKGREFRAGGRSAETQFKRGNTPHTWRPIGSTSTSRDGYLLRKVSDTGITRRDYALVHQLVWRMHGRAAPNHRTHALVFIDGNKRNFDINNLELVSRAELMRRNSVHNLPPEVAEVVQLRGQIVRRINQREKREKETA